MRLLDMQPRDRATLAAVLLSSACVSVGCVVAILASGLAAKLGVFVALVGLAALLVNLGD